MVCDSLKMSHPSWVCGLKLVKYNYQYKGVTSHPSWVCGLKLIRTTERNPKKASHPSWVCGLKRTFAHVEKRPCVTPFVGVWIETAEAICMSAALRHTLRGCVD